LPPSASSGRGSAHSDPSGILAKLGPGFATGDVHAGLPGVVLDFAELRNRAKGENCRAPDARRGKQSAV